MASVEITVNGILYDKLNRTTQNVVLVGEASLTGLGVGGGPIIPGGPPPGTGIWPNPPEGQAPIPSHPIMLPGMPGWGLPPGGQPPTTPPNPGDPTTPLPPPAGSGGWPVQPIQPPSYIVVWYPGIGPIVVPPPASTGDAGRPAAAKK